MSPIVFGGLPIALICLTTGWICNHVPNGIAGLIIFIVYILVLGALSIFLIIKFGSVAMAAEMESKTEQRRAAQTVFVNPRNDFFPDNLMRAFENDGYRRWDKCIESGSGSFNICYYSKIIKESKLFKPAFSVFALVKDWQPDGDIENLANLIGEEINAAPDLKGDCQLQLSTLFIENNLDPKTIEYCLSNWMETFFVYIPVAYERSSGKMYFLKGTGRQDRAYMAQVKRIEQYLQ